MAFRPLEEILGPIQIVVKGETYSIPVLSAEDGLKLHSIINGDQPETTAGEMVALLLGDTYQLMLDAKLSPATVDRVFFTALADFRNGRDAAEEVWEHGIPKEIPALVAAAVEAAQTTPQAAATTTKPPASTSGTKSRKRAAQ
jgi:hypothetical protein